MIDDAIIESLAKIGNLKRVMREVEPQTMQPQELKEWMVRRTLYAITLFQKEYENEVQRSQQGNNRNDVNRRGEGICKVPKE